MWWWNPFLKPNTLTQLQWTKHLNRIPWLAPQLVHQISKEIFLIFISKYSWDEGWSQSAKLHSPFHHSWCILEESVVGLEVQLCLKPPSIKGSWCRSSPLWYGRGCEINYGYFPMCRPLRHLQDGHINKNHKENGNKLGWMQVSTNTKQKHSKT